MSPLLSSLLALVLGTAAAFALLPLIIRAIGRQWGRAIRSRTQQRRELLLGRAAAEEDEEQRRIAEQRSAVEGGSTAGSSASLASSSTSEDGWEKVSEGREDGGQRTPTQSTTPAPEQTKAADAEFEGIIGFFHPFCNAGGGGERVLFAAIHATQRRYPRALCVVYTGDHDATKEQILLNVRNRFNISLHAPRIAFLYPSAREYAHFTLLGQSLGSLVLGWDAFGLLVPDVFIDTMGYAFVLALAKWLFPSMPTGAYVHYPTISTDMLASLSSSANSGQGLNAGSGAGVRGKVKQLYWESFAKLYSWVGGSVDVVMTNSSWTQNHVSSLWSRSRTARGKKRPISVVYPPCAVEELQEKIPLTSETSRARTRNILYIAQFRPEKQHGLIIDAFHTFLKNLSNTPDKYGPSDVPRPNLIFVGSVRDDQDEKRVYKLRLQAQSIKDSVQFVINAKWDQILQFLKESSVGVNGMWNEHFGIGVVEYQAAGLISVVNGSGGPKEDIVVPIDGEDTGTSLCPLLCEPCIWGS
jgi:alpha-1,2-mannosyltransferase